LCAKKQKNQEWKKGNIGCQSFSAGNFCPRKLSSLKWATAHDINNKILQDMVRK
jgi:hypothetical protein